MAPAECEGDSACLLSATAELQDIARACSQASTAIELRINFQALHVIGAVDPWRLIETAGSLDGSRRRRRMLCFASPDQVRITLEAITTWIRADLQFSATHMVTPGGFPGVTGDWVHAADFGTVFGPSRQLLRNDHGWTVLASARLHKVGCCQVSR